MPRLGFSTYEHDGFRGQVRSDLGSEFMAFVERLDLSSGEMEQRHYAGFASPTDRMVTTVDVPARGGTRKAVLKQDDFTRSFNLVKAVKYAFKPSRGLRAWDAMNMMHEKGLPVPEPYAYIEKRRLGFFLKGYLLMERIEDCADLGAAVREDPGARGLLREAGSLVRRFHDMGFTHGDLKATNVLARRGDASPRLYIIDFEDVRFPGRVKKKEREAELSRLMQGLGALAREIEQGYEDCNL